MSTKLILDTDIGTNVDDAWALALCLACQEIDLIGITLVHADLDTRAKIALKMLKLAGRADIPVIKGESTPMTPSAGLYWPGHEGSKTDFSDIDGLHARDGGVDFILKTIDRNPGEVALCSIGPMTNIGTAISRAPEVMRRLKKLVIMGTTFAGEGTEYATPEHNAVLDPDATRTVLESRIPATVIGLNITSSVMLKREDIPSLEGTPFGDYLALMTYQYLDLCGRDFTWMHDPLAVASIVDPSVVATRTLRAEVVDDGSVAYFVDAVNGVLKVGVAVDVALFESLLLDSIRAFVHNLGG